MYTLVKQDEGFVNVRQIYYKTPCGQNVLVGEAYLIPQDNDAQVLFYDETSNLNRLEKVAELLRVELKNA